eukprot:scaffold109042_cov48-Phaeocystis_antarctica.AAC.1
MERKRVRKLRIPKPPGLGVRVTAARPDGLAGRLAVGATRAHALDELEEGRLGPGLALEHDIGEDLHQHVLALHVDQNLVAHDGEVDEAGAAQHGVHHGARAGGRVGPVAWRPSKERRVQRRRVCAKAQRTWLGLGLKQG